MGMSLLTIPLISLWALLPLLFIEWPIRKEKVLLQKVCCSKLQLFKKKFLFKNKDLSNGKLLAKDVIYIPFQLLVKLTL